MSRNERMPALRVECYASQRAEESPRRFLIGQRKTEFSFFQINVEQPGLIG